MRAGRLAIAVLAAVPLSACLAVGGKPAPVVPPCCTMACVETVLGCKIYPEGSPDFTCFTSKYSSEDMDAGPAVALYASEACNIGNEGAEVGCIAHAFPGDACARITADAGSALQMEIALACPAGFSPGPCDGVCVTCAEECEASADQCNGDCLDAGTFYGCLGCNAGCNQAQTQCQMACQAM